MIASPPKSGRGLIANGREGGEELPTTPCSQSSFRTPRVTDSSVLLSLAIVTRSDELTSNIFVLPKNYPYLLSSVSQLIRICKQKFLHEEGFLLRGDLTNNSFKCIGLVGCKVCKDFSIETDILFLKKPHERTV